MIRAAATLSVCSATSGIATTAAMQTGIGVVTETDMDARDGSEDTAEAVVDLPEPHMEGQGWFDD